MEKLRQICLLFVLCACAVVIRGQSISSDFYANLNGDIWRYNLAQSSATQLTHSGFNGGPILSPDGSKFAFLETAPQFVVRFKSGAVIQTAGTPPVDIWLYDIPSRTFTRVADQSGASPGGFLRSIPTWSPDSRQLAWLQIDPYRQLTYQAWLQIYSLDTGLTTSLSEDIDLGAQEGHIRMPSVLWGSGGIARTLLTICTAVNRHSYSWRSLTPAAAHRRNTIWNCSPTIAIPFAISCGQSIKGAMFCCSASETIGRCWNRWMDRAFG